MKTPCRKCGLEVAGKPHQTADDCLVHLLPRYRLALSEREEAVKRRNIAYGRVESMKTRDRSALRELGRLKRLVGQMVRYGTEAA